MARHAAGAGVARLLLPAVQERALDRAMRREFTSVDEDLRDAAVALYRDRWGLGREEGTERGAQGRGC